MVNSSGLISKPRTTSTSSHHKRESRHIQIQGLFPQAINIDRLQEYFSTFGRVQKLDWLWNDSSTPYLIVSFCDRPSAINVIAAKDLQIDGISIGASFFETRSAHAAQHPSTVQQQTKSNLVFNKTTSQQHSDNQKDLFVTENSSTQRRTTSGSTLNKLLQGVTVIFDGTLPAKIAEASIKQQLSDLLLASRSKCKLIDISFEHAGDATRALLLLKDVNDMDLLLAELSQQSLSSYPGQRLKVRIASQSAVTNAYNNLSSRSSFGSLAQPDSASSNPAPSHSSPDARQKDACRTLYVGNLDKYCKEDTLITVFNEFGHILEVDIKNRDSFAPFAFIQFTNIESVVTAIIQNQSNKLNTAGLRNDRGKLKLNFGKAIIPSTKVWIGALPRSCSQEYLLSRLKDISPDGIQEIEHDSENNEALVIFRNIEQAQLVYNKIKSKFVILPEKPQKDSQLLAQQVDFASDKLYDFFLNRKHGRYRSTTIVEEDSLSTSTTHQGASSSKKNTGSDLKRTTPGRERSSLVGTSSNESLLAPPPDPPQNLQPVVEEVETEQMSSRHNRRSNSRRSSPDQGKHRRDWDKERHERRSDPRAYSSHYRDKKYEKKRSDRRGHHHRSQSSSSSSSTSSGGSRSSVTSSSSSLSNSSGSPKNTTKVDQKTKSAALMSSQLTSPATLMPAFLGYPPLNQPPPIPPPIKTPTAPLKRSDAIDSTFPSTTSSLDPESSEKASSRPSSSQTSVQQKQNIQQPPKSAPILAGNNKPNFKTSSSTSGSKFVGRYRSSYSKGSALDIEPDSDQSRVDPRLSNQNYKAHANKNKEPPIRFPAFYLNDELGRQYSRRMPIISQRRNSHTTSHSRQKSDFHPAISRSSSGSDHGRTPSSGIEMPLGFLSFDMPLVPPYPPPPLGTPLESPGLIDIRHRSDSNADLGSFSDRHQPKTSVPSSQRQTTFEEDLQRVKMRISSVAKSSDSSHPPTSKSNDGRKPAGRLTINIPAPTSNSSTPNIASPAFQSQDPTPGPTPGISTISNRSMSFSQQGNLSSCETPLPSVASTPRSSSCNFVISPASSSLPLPPPQPPTLQMTSPRTSEKILSPKTNPTLKATPMISPTITQSGQPTPSTLQKSELTPTLTIKQSTVTSPLTTPSTPRSASSAPSIESKTPTMATHRDSIDSNTEEARRKKHEEKLKLLQSLRVPKKARDSNPTEEIFSFSSPLSRASHGQPTHQSTQHSTMPVLNPMIARTKPIEKSAPKLPHITNIPTINRSSTQSSLYKAEKKSRTVDEKERLKPSKSSSMLLSKTDPRLQKTSSGLSGALSEKERRNSEVLIDSETKRQSIKRIREKAAKKFPTDEKEREKYIRKKQEKLRQRIEEIVLHKEKQKEVAPKKPGDVQKKLLQKKSSEQRLPTKPIKESSKEVKPKEKIKEKKDMAEKPKQKASIGRKRRQRTPSESVSESESEEDNSSEILAECGLRQSDLEMQRILFEEAKTGQLNLSMYERVRRRRMATQSDEQKKSHALEVLRESKKKEKKGKRVQLSSDDESGSNAAGSHRRSKVSASDSDSDQSDASTAASSSSALKSKKQPKLESLQKKKADKQKKIEKTSPTRKLMKKLGKKDDDESDSDARSGSSKLKMEKKTTVESSDIDSNDEDMVVKKLKKNLSAYNNDSDDSESDVSARNKFNKKSLKKLKSKKTGNILLGDEDFRGNFDDDKRSSNPKKLHKSGRPKDKMKTDEQNKLKGKKQKKRGEDEPVKKKPKVSSVRPESIEDTRKRRASSEIENIPNVKRQRPEDLSKMSPMDDFSFDQMSPTQSTTSEGVRLENFVTQSCEPKEHASLISSLTSGHFGPANSEGSAGQDNLISKRARTSSSGSSSTNSSSGSSTYSSTSATTPITKKSALSRKNSDASSKTTERLQTFRFVKTSAEDQDVAKASSAECEQKTTEKPNKIVSTCPVEEPNDANSYQDDSDDDYEAMLVQQLKMKEDSIKEKAVESNVERSQETEDAVESINVLMNSNQPRSEDEEDEAFTLITRNGRLNQSDKLMSLETEQNDGIKNISPQQQQVYPPDPAPTLVASGKISPISSVVESIAHGIPFNIDNIATTSSFVNDQKPNVSTVASVISSHLPTPPSRSSTGSPISQYLARQQSPLIVSKSAQPSATNQQIPAEVVQKRLSDGSIQMLTAQQENIGQEQIPSSVTGIQLPPNLAQLQQQILSQRGGSIDERELMTLASKFMTEKTQQFMQPSLATTSASGIQAPFAQPIPTQPTQHRSRAGSQSTGTRTPQRKSGTVSASPAPQQIVGRNVTTTANQPANTSHTQSPITTNPQTMVSPNTQMDALIGSLSQILSMNPSLNNSIAMQQLLSNPQFLTYLPQLATNPQALEQLIRLYHPMQINQQSAEVEKILKHIMQSLGPNASPQAINQAFVSLMQHEQRFRQEQEFVEKQKQIVLSQYETAIRSNQMISEEMARQQVLQQQRMQLAQIPSSKQCTQHLDENRYPICWQGNLTLKSNETFVQMHHVSGNQHLIEATASELASLTQDGPILRINQRMKLQNPHLHSVCSKMNDENEFVALICLPCGHSPEQVTIQTTKMTSTFIDYFTSKMAAGVVTRGAHVPHPTCVAHVFPPCEFSSQQLRRLAPELLEKIEKLRSTYLFVVVTRNDGTGIPSDTKVHMLPVIQPHTVGKTL